MKYLVAGCLLLFSCNTQKGLFGNRTEHEKYEDRLREAGLLQTEMGLLWQQAAQHALTSPSTISIPFREAGFFPADKPLAAGYVFEARRGDRVDASVERTPPGSGLFVDLYSLQDTKPKHEVSADSSGIIKFEVKENGRYLLRLQPPLLESRGYTLIIKTAPSLTYPLPKGEGRIQSYWGAARDGGARSHEGIDIFAARNTPAVAAADGRITRVGENNLGGNIIFMRPSDKNISLYYAHLEKQLVETGQQVKAGDTIGLIGNSGNARNTPPHLHFGIYAMGGAIDPLPFVDPVRKSPPPILEEVDVLGDTAITRYSLNEPGIPAETPVRIIAASAARYKVLLPGGEMKFLDSRAVTFSRSRKIELAEAGILKSKPVQTAAIMRQLEPGSYTLLGRYQGYALVKAGNFTGWVQL